MTTKLEEAVAKKETSEIEAEALLKALRSFIEAYDKAKEEGRLPTFKDLHGMAPNATGGIPAEDFVANLGEKAKGE